MEDDTSRAELTLGSFTVSPASGVVAAGGVAVITAKFVAGTEAESCASAFVVDVTDRSPEEDPKGLQYELLGESCVPGIATDDYASIFEEQAVQRRGDFGASGLPQNVFGEEERIFCFGSHMARRCRCLPWYRHTPQRAHGVQWMRWGLAARTLPPHMSRVDTGRLEGRMLPRVRVSTATTHGPQVGHELSERLKIVNPFRVSCTVDLRTRGQEAAQGAPLAFEVEPKRCVIPPHEHRYVTLFFNPHAMATHTGVFEAEVEHGTDPATRLLAVDLLGEGTLPHVVASVPSSTPGEGQPQLQFARVMVGRAIRRQVRLHNAGILPASFSLAMQSDGQFLCEAVEEPMSLPPNEIRMVEVTFQPSEAGDFKGALSLSVVDNAFDATQVQLSGEAFVQDVAVEGLMNGDAEGDALNYSDVGVGLAKSINFTLHNYSSTPYRFEWESLPGLTFAPGVGHLLPGAAKQVVATFLSAEPLEHDAAEVALQLTKVRYTQAETPADWDDSMTTAQWLTDAEYRLWQRDEAVAAKAAAAVRAENERIRAWNADPKNQGKPVPPPPAADEDGDEAEVEPPEGADGEAAQRSEEAASPAKRHRVVKVDPEPAYEALTDGEGDDMTARPKVFATARCAHGWLESETSSVNFKPTMMFQTRTFSFPLANTGPVAMDFAWSVAAAGPGQGHVGVSNAPFSIAPEAGTIPPGGTQQIQVSFSPEEVDSYTRRLVCACDNLEPGREPPTLALSGRATRPFCHFELSDSDYLSSGRRSPEMPGPDGSLAPLDPSTRTIEFESLGTRVRNTRRFFIVNPTNVPYEFLWESEQELRGGADVLGHRPFRCNTRKGMVQPGRKYEMVFEFTPESAETAESFWRFRIPSLKIEVPFLLAGSIAEPNVTLDRTRHNFGPRLLGQTAREVVNIVNTEHIPFAFVVDRSSFATGGPRSESMVEVSPLRGTVGPNSSLPLEISFRPTLEQRYNFNVDVSVRNKTRPLVLNLKGEGYVIHGGLLLEGGAGRPIELSPHSPTVVDFGAVHINDRVTKQLTVVNSGRYTFDASMSLLVPPSEGRRRPPPLTIVPEQATVKRNERCTFELSYRPSSDAPLPEGLELSCKIINGRSYRLKVLGRGRRPQLAFSTRDLDFGPCFVVKDGMAPQTASLLLTNNDEHEVNFELQLDPVPWLSASAPRAVLAPGEQSEVSLTFSPAAVGKHETRLRFLVNGLWVVAVRVGGEGCEMRFELAEPSDQRVHFGAVRPKQPATRSITLVNRSRREVEVSALEAAEALRAKSVALTLGGEGATQATVRPRGSVQLLLRFAPEARIPRFSQPVVLQVCSLARPLLLVDGSCIAMDVKLEADQVAFGQVMLGSKVTRRVMLQNNGDLPSAFKLDPSDLAPDFSVSPVKGFLQPNEDVNLAVTFHPAALNRDIRYERVPITVDGQEPPRLTLTGMCVDAEAQPQELRFETRVREPAAQSVEISNPSQTLWRISPVLVDEAWSGAEVLEIPSGESAAYHITYSPLAMTRDGEEHEGSAFFPLPDGSAILYRLWGTAEAPAPSSEVVQTVACKEAHTFSLAVGNWLKEPQRFRVELRAPEADPSTQLKGLDSLDVPAGGARDYSLGFYAYKPGVTEVEVHFVNERNGEYVFHRLRLEAEPAGVQSTIEMLAPLRQLTAHELALPNPLDVEATFSIKVDSPEVACPAVVTVPPKGHGVAKLEWRPLLPREQTARLTVSSPELGEYLHDVRLATLPSGEQNALRSTAALGESQALRFRFRNFLQKAETYQVKLRSGGAGFSAAATVSAPAANDMRGAEASVDLTFEPSRLGAFTDTLVVSSPDGGEHVCTLHGQSLPPKPQGPIAVAAGGSAQVPFKNVYDDSVDFAIACEPAAFSVAKPRETVPGKKSISVAVAFKPEEGQPTSAKGKLTISATVPGSEPCQWLYYLSGESSS